MTNGTVSSAPITAAVQAIAPSFLLFSAKGYVAAEHADFRLLGPATLYPGLSTPAEPGETILVFGVGFGLPATTLASGSAQQFGSLPALPVCTIGSIAASVSAATLISPGLYQLNVIVPKGVPGGDNEVSCTYSGIRTPPGSMITLGSTDPQPMDLTGTWSGTASDSTGPGRMTWRLTQTGTMLAGSVSALTPSGTVVFNGTFSGTITGTNLRFAIEVPKGGIVGFPGCSVSINGSSTNITTSGIAGIYTGNNSCTGPFSSGSFSLMKQ